MEALNINLSPFFEWLLKTTTQGSVLICLIFLVKVVLRQKLLIRWHYYLWLILLARLALPWSPQSAISIFNLLPQPGSQQRTETFVEDIESSDIAEYPGKGSADTEQATLIPNGATSTDSEQSETQAISEPTYESVVTATERLPSVTTEPTQAIKTVFSDILPSLWLLGALILAVYISLRNIILWRAIKRERQVTDQQILELLEDCKMQMQVQTVVGVVVTDKVKSPALFGFVRPRLLLPQGLLEELDLDELQYVFLHELAHLRRRDIYLGWAVSLLQVLHWFNPLIWFAFRRMRTDQELACDALALSKMNAEEPQQYGRTLVNLFERFSQVTYVPSIAGILEDKSQLERRIKMITKFNKKSYQWSPLAVILIMILSCVSLPDAVSIKATETASLKSSNQPKFTKIQIPNRIPQYAQLSPDGKSIAFVNDDRIWIMPMSSRLGPGYSGEPRLLDTGEVPIDRTDLTWSGDSKWIAFNGKQVDNGCQKIYIVSADGGEPREVHENNRHSIVLNYRMSLSPNGKTLAFSTFDGHGIYIETISVEGGSPKRLVDAPSREPVFSPDGHTIAYVESKNLGAGGGALWTVPASGGTPTLVADANNASSPVWSPEGRMIAFIDYGVGLQIYLVPVTKDGRPAGKKFRLELPEGTEGAIRLTGWTPDNKIGALYTKKEEFALYTRPIEGGKASFITVGGYPLQPRWSPDGKVIYHTNDPDDTSGDWERYAIAYVPAEGGDVTTIPIKSEDKITIWGYGTGNRVSPDGKTIVFAGQTVQEENLNRLNIWTIPTEGGEPKQLTSPPAGFTDWYPCWSHDGQDIVFVREKLSDVWSTPVEGGIYVVSSKGGEPSRITWESDRIYSAGPVLWSPDGELLAFYSRDKNKVDRALCVIQPNGSELKIVANVVACKELAWSPDSKRIAFQGSEEGVIKIVSLEDGNLREIKVDLVDTKIYHLDWSPDGESLAFAGYTGGGLEFWMMENFLPETPVIKPTSQTTLRQVWAGPDVDPHVAASPDGRYLSYVDWNTGDLAIREIATGKTRRLTSKGNLETARLFALYSVISPDSRLVAYSWSNEHGTLSLCLVGIDGSADRTLYASEDHVVFPICWSSDSKKIVARRHGAESLEIILVSVEKGSVDVLKKCNKPPYWDNFCYSSNDRFIIYDFPSEDNLSNYDIGIFDTQDNSETLLIEHPANDRLLGRLPNREEILFLSDRAGSQDIWTMKVIDGKAQISPRPISRDIGQINPHGLTQDGSFYFSRYTRRFTTNIVPFDVQTGEIHEQSNKPLLGSNSYPAWSPDGESMAYVTEKGDNRRLHIRSLSTGEERELASNFEVRNPRWSPDGRFILAPGFDLSEINQEGYRGGIYKIDIQNGQATQLVGFPPERQVGWARSTAEWSLDGKAIFYLAPKGIIRRELESGQEKQLYLSDNLTRAIDVSPDGKILTFCEEKPDEGTSRIMIIPVSGGEPKELCKFEEPEGEIQVPRSIVWTPDGNYVLFTKDETKGSAIWRVTIQGGDPQMIIESSDNMHHSLGVHPNGEEIAYSTYLQEGAIWVMENFLPTMPVVESEPATTLRRLPYTWGASLSPDGKYMCGVDWSTETERLMLRDLVTGSVTALTNSGHPEYAAISPNSTRVAYLSYDPNWENPGLYTIGIDGTDRRCIRDGDCLIPKDWSPDGTRILALEYDKDPKQLVWVSVADGSLETIVFVDRYYLQGEGHPGKFEVSPDGRFIAYDHLQSDSDTKHDLVIFDLNENRENAIASHLAHEKLLGWTPDGRSVFFASDRTGTWDGWLQRVTNGISEGFPELIRQNMGDITPIGFAHGGAFYYHTGSSTRDVFVAALDFEESQVLSSPMPVCQTGASNFPAWSPDGKKLAYCTRSPEGTRFIHIRDTATGQEHEIDTNLQIFAHLCWSPDGQSILGVTGDEPPHSIYQIDVQTGERTILVEGATVGLGRCELFADGKTLLYVRQEPARYVIRDLTTGREEDLVRAEHPLRLRGFALSPDKQLLVYITSVGSSVRSQALNIVTTTGGEPRELIQFEESEQMWLFSPAWTPDGQDVLFVKWLMDDRGGELWRISTQGGEAHKVWMWKEPFISLCVHPDGQHIAFHTSTTIDEMWVMENFLPEETED